MPATPPNTEQRKEFVSQAVEAAIRIALISIMAIWCFQIVQPFVFLVAWGVVIAVALHPLHVRLTARLGGREGLSAVLLTLLGLLILLLPTLVLSRSLLDGVMHIAEKVRSGTLEIPPPPERLEQWPLAGGWLHTFWSMAADNLHGLLDKFAPQLKPFGAWLLQKASQLGLAVLKFCASICIAGFLMYKAQAGHRFAVRLAARLTGENFMEYLNTASATIRSVALGVLGVAVIQSLAAALGMVIAGIPLAGLWAFLVLFVAIVQVPSIVVLGPLCAYSYTLLSPTAATVFTIWGLAVGLSDNVLKPLLFGRGVQIPMLVILLGAIGGMVVTGIIGLFLGAVILSLGYMLFGTWLNATPEAQAQPQDSAPPPA